MEALKENFNYTGTVMSIHESADSFRKTTGGGGTVHCHYMTILVSGMGDEPYNMQICTDHPRFDQFEVNDTIKFTTFKYAKGMWTIRFLDKAAKPKSSTAVVKAEEAPAFTGKNPHVAGTAMERAIGHAAHFLQMRGSVSDEDFLALAEKLYNKIMEKVG